MSTFLENLQCVLRLEYPAGIMLCLFLFGCLGAWFGSRPPYRDYYGTRLFGLLGIVVGFAVGATGQALLHNACGIKVG